jgi:hypothetical protein
MNMQVPITPENHALGAAVHRRMLADSRIVNSKAAMYRTLGIGGALGMVGLACAACIYAYSYVTDARASAEKIAAAFEQALAKVTLKTEGDVKLQPGGEVALADKALKLEGATVNLAPGTSIPLDASNTQVRLASNQRVGVEGEVGLRSGATVGVTGNVGINGGVPGTTPVNFGGDTQERNGARVMSSITAFKTVKFGQGEIVTGWNYKTSNDTAPHQQYCYYNQGVEGANVRIDIATNGRPINVVRPPRGFDLDGAISNCIWYNG